ncbi:MAG: hypothetical protein SGILL_001215, partial [Bacillariaceae sp.]
MFSRGLPTRRSKQQKEIVAAEALQGLAGKNGGNDKGDKVAGNSDTESEATVLPRDKRVLKWEKDAWVWYVFRHKQPIQARVVRDCFGDDEAEIKFYDELNMKFDDQQKSVSQEWLKSSNVPWNYPKETSAAKTVLEKDGAGVEKDTNENQTDKGKTMQDENVSPAGNEAAPRPKDPPIATDTTKAAAAAGESASASAGGGSEEKGG